MTNRKPDVPRGVRYAAWCATVGVCVGAALPVAQLPFYTLAPETSARRLDGLTFLPALALFTGGGLLAGLLRGTLGQLATREALQRAVAGLTLAAFFAPLLIAGYWIRGSAATALIIIVMVGSLFCRDFFFGPLPKGPTDGGGRGAV